MACDWLMNLMFVWRTYSSFKILNFPGFCCSLFLGSKVAQNRLDLKQLIIGLFASVFYQLRWQAVKECEQLFSNVLLFDRRAIILRSPGKR